jgi:hypothetical protein
MFAVSEGLVGRHLLPPLLIYTVTGFTRLGETHQAPWCSELVPLETAQLVDPQTARACTTGLGQRPVASDNFRAGRGGQHWIRKQAHRA